jgi:hypothetical protein
MLQGTPSLSRMSGFVVKPYNVPVGAHLQSMQFVGQQLQTEDLVTG